LYFFTADEHYYHKNIIKYCNRPFKNLTEMHKELIKRNNEIVTKNDIVIHGGDFTFLNKYQDAQKIIDQLNGNHFFIRGSHDKWMNQNYHEIWQRRINNNHIVVCHFAMIVWPKSHHNSILLFGHSHGRLNDIIQGKCYDIGVDNNNYYPISEEKIFLLMEDKPDNFNFIKGAERR